MRLNARVRGEEAFVVELAVVNLLASMHSSRGVSSETLVCAGQTEDSLTVPLIEGGWDLGLPYYTLPAQPTTRQAGTLWSLPVEAGDLPATPRQYFNRLTTTTTLQVPRARFLGRLRRSDRLSWLHDLPDLMSPMGQSVLKANRYSELNHFIHGASIRSTLADDLFSTNVSARLREAISTAPQHLLRRRISGP